MSHELSHDLSIYTSVLKGPRVCNTTKQEAPPSKQHYEDQGALQTGQRQTGGDVQIRVGSTKRPKITLKELQSSTAEIGVSVHRTTLSRTLHRAGLYGRVGRKKLLLKEKISKYVWCLSNIWKKVLWSDETKIELFVIKENTVAGANPTPLITPITPSPQ